MPLNNVMFWKSKKYLYSSVDILDGPVFNSNFYCFLPEKYYEIALRKHYYLKCSLNDIELSHC